MTDIHDLNPQIDQSLTSDPFVETPAPDAETTAVLLHADASGVATVTINRPARKNAFDQATIAALREAFETLHGADHVRVVFVRGAGGTFCAGADLEWMADSVDWTESDNREDALDLARMLKALNDIPALTVALVEGAAMGGGAGLVAACDMAVAVAGSKFAFSEVKLGLIPATISPYVVDAIGPRQAKGLFCTGRLFDAAYAAGIGLVQEVVADSAGLDAARDRISADILRAAPEAVLQSKRLVWDVWGKKIDDDLMHETSKRIARKRTSAEGQEGVRAFLDKRKPSWMT
jgi:methylglutaconyl-CoA hydratase